MLCIFGAAKEALQLVNTMTDPDKRKKAYQLYVTKQRSKAMDAAEKLFILADDYLEGRMDRLRFKKKFRKLNVTFIRNK